MADGISRERLEELAQTLYYPAEGEPDSAARVEAERFVETTLQASQESTEARIIMERYLGIISREEAVLAQQKEASQRPIDTSPEVAEQAPRAPEAILEEDLEELPEEDPVEELRAFVSDDAGFSISYLVAEHVFRAHHSIVSEAEKWGAGDTVVREAADGVLSRALIGRDWPLNRDRLTESELTDFLLELRIGYDALHKDLLSKKQAES